MQATYSNIQLEQDCRLPDRFSRPNQYDSELNQSAPSDTRECQSLDSDRLNHFLKKRIQERLSQD